MTRTIRLLTLALAAMLLLAAAACKTGGGDGSGADSGGGEPIDLVSADPRAVLSETLQNFDEEVTSVEMEMEMSFGLGGFALDATAEMAYQAPDRMYMTMDMGFLGEVEAMLVGTDMYMRLPGEGWVVFSFEDLLGGDLEELGIDAGSFEEQWNEHSLIDFKEAFEGVGGVVQDLGDEVIDGKTYRHYRGSLDVASVMSSLGEPGGYDPSEFGLDEVSGPMIFDYWFDPETFFPYKVSMGGDLTTGGEALTMDMTIVMTGYNGDVTLPDPPANATPLTDFFDEAFSETY